MAAWKKYRVVFARMIIMNDPRIARSRGQLADQLSGLPSQHHSWGQLKCLLDARSCMHHAAVTLLYVWSTPGPSLGACSLLERTFFQSPLLWRSPGPGRGGGNWSINNISHTVFMIINLLPLSSFSIAISAANTPPPTRPVSVNEPPKLIEALIRS